MNKCKQVANNDVRQDFWLPSLASIAAAFESSCNRRKTCDSAQSKSDDDSFDFADCLPNECAGRDMAAPS